MLHHVALCPQNMDESLRFYRDGIGLKQLMDEEIPGNWRYLFNARSDNLRAIFLGDPERPDAGIVELVMFDKGVDDRPIRNTPANGFLLILFMVDVPATLTRLANLGLDLERKEDAPVEGEEAVIALVRDPDGVLVELIPFGIVSEMYCK